MAEAAQSPRPRRKLPCGATSCGGCVKECGVVVYKYIAGLDLDDDRESFDPSIPDESSPFSIRNS